MFEPIDKWTPPEKPLFLSDFPPPRVFSKMGSFVWWWWMLLFDEDGVKKQIVAFWTAKTYKDVLANGVDWGPAAEISGSPADFSYKGIATFWHWDGEGFCETPPKNQTFRTKVAEGALSVESDDVRLSSGPNGTSLSFCRDPSDFRLDVESVAPNPPPVGYRRTMLTKSMGFDALKIYHARWKGKLSTKGREREVSGSLYMQHICLNTPAFPWLWGVFHKKDGSYLTYFTTFLGPLMFRRKAECEPGWDNTFRFLNKNLNYTPAGSQTKRFKHVRYRVFRQESGLPGFEARGELGNERLRVRVKAVAKCTYEFERKKFWRNRFFYNEFPSEVVEIEHTDAAGKTHREGGAEWNGNTEYSWGLLLS
ncbi:MAG: hypothetical protein V1934_00955 [Methanobacteriota archaeon]